MIDINEVVKELSVDDVKDIMESIGCDDYIEKEREIIFRTGCHHKYPEDGSHKLYYYKNSGLFVCYTCCGTFDMAGMLRRRYEVLEQDYNFYEDIVLRLATKAKFKDKTLSSFYQPYDLDFNKYNKTKINVNLKHLNPNILNTFIFNPTPEWLSDGISEEAMKYYQIRYSIEENKVIIPHYNEEGYLIGIRGRALNLDDVATQGKYRPIIVNGETLSHPLGYNLYGLNFVGGNIRRLGIAIIGEGEKAALQYMTMFGQKDNVVVASCGSNISEYQIELLLRCGANKILIAFDKTGETWQEQDKYYNKLKKLCERFNHKAQMGFIWDSQNLLKLKESPFDQGRETFLNLYWKNTIWL